MVIFGAIEAVKKYFAALNDSKSIKFYQNQLKEYETSDYEEKKGRSR